MKLKNLILHSLLCCFATFVLPPHFISAGKVHAAEQSLYDIPVELISGEKFELSKYSGKVLLITNIALKCGSSYQLEALQKLYDQFSDQGLVILGFPSSDFTKEVLKDGESVRSYCTKKYGVKFPLFVPDTVVGPDKQPVFKYLTTKGPKSTRGEVDFNFEKFLIDKKGKLKGRYCSFTGANSDALVSRIKELLNE